MLCWDGDGCVQFRANPTETGSRTAINMEKYNKGYQRYEMSLTQGRVNRLWLFRFEQRDDVKKQFCEFMYGAEKIICESLSSTYID